jgi:hypothetical protein
MRVGRRTSALHHPALVAAAALGLHGCSGTVSQGALFADIPGQAGSVLAPVESVEDRRFATVVRQAYDFSCGSAALATLLRYHYGGRQDEQTVFRGMWANGDREQIRRLGFSLLDMKRYLATIGLEAEGYQVTLEEIAAAGVPGIALINLDGYRHFVVVKGISAGEVLVGDPSRGLVTMPVEQFRSAWNGVYFALDSALDRGRRAFNRDSQWAQFSRAPTGGQFIAPLSQQALMLTAPFYREF